MQEHWMRPKITAQNTNDLLYNPLRPQCRQPDGNITNGSRQHLMLRNLLSPRPKESSKKAKNHGQHRRIYGSIEIVFGHFFKEGTAREQKGTP